MREKAEKLGANAVISLQFQTSVVMSGAAEMVTVHGSTENKPLMNANIQREAKRMKVGLCQ
jgi:hypothetical protein